MSDTYVECLVKAKQPVMAKILQIILVVLTVIFGLAMIMYGPVPLVIAAVCGVGAYFLNLFTDLEYEYLYLDKEIVIDKIMAKSRRKRVAAFSVDRIEILAPFKSYHLDDYKNRNVKASDYSIGEEQKPDLRYVAYCEGGVKMVLSPSPEFVKAVKNVAPRKVFTD